jgi:hypothetical protein
MSTEPLIRELFRGLEATLHERLSMIEQVLHSVEKPKVPLYDHEFVSRIERLEKLVAASPSNHSLLYSRLTAAEANLASLFSEIEQIRSAQKSVSLPSPILPLRSFTVEVPVNELLLSGDEKHLDEEPPVEVDEELAEEEEEAEEEAAEEEEEEEEGLAVEEFTYKGKTYYKDEENQVYEMDEEGGLSDPIGSWNGKRIIPFTH